jgi:hypothetical protein
MELWWECSECKAFDLCYNCEKKDVLDKIHMCQATGLREPYQHVSIKLGDFYVERLVEKRLSIHYCNMQVGIIEQIVAYVSSKAEGNITLALLYLEDVFTWDDVSNLSLDRVDDRLPKDVIAYFDTEICFIERQPEPQRLPPLLAIVAAADYNYTYNQSGIPLEKLEECICLAQSACSNLDYPRSVEDVFAAANGWLTNLHTKNREVDICCKPSFTLYAQEDYKEFLAWARHQMIFNAERDSGTVASKQLQESASSLELPDFLGSTLDTLASETLLLTPPRSIDDSLGIPSSEVDLMGRYSSAKARDWFNHHLEVWLSLQTKSQKKRLRKRIRQHIHQHRKCATFASATYWSSIHVQANTVFLSRVQKLLWIIASFAPRSTPVETNFRTMTIGHYITGPSERYHVAENSRGR